jgi:beta-mannosidase
MFIDCWPSITWSVVDYYGKKKAGYFALQKAFQPLYISIGLRQKKYLNGKKLNIDFWLINDFQNEFKNCSIHFKIGDKIISEIPLKKITEDSIQYFNWEKNEIFLPESLNEGNYKVDVVIFNKEKKLLSHNDFEIEIVVKR